MITSKNTLWNVLTATILLLSSLGLSYPNLAAQAAAAAEKALHSPEALSTAIIQFPGQGRSDSGNDALVPDTAGAAGHLHYLQAVNEKVALYHKDGRYPGESTVNPPSGNPLFAATFETFWATADTGTACDGGAGHHHGQPAVIYDHMAGRFVVTDIAYADINTGPYYICIAVSNGVTPPTPTGGSAYFNSNYWYYYALDTNVGVYRYLPQKPKIGLWPDGYYLSADLFDVYNSGMNLTPRGLKVWALNRNDLVGGRQEEFQFVTFYLNEALGYEHLVPSHLMGIPPQTGTPNLFASIEPGVIYFWKFSVNWINPQLSTFGIDLEPNYSLNNDTNERWALGYLIPQPNTVERLEAHGERLTSPLAYRIVDGIPTWWASHTITYGSATALRWYELQPDPDPAAGGAPLIAQQGTYQPDGHYRWLPSLAIDRAGNMAIGYSVASSLLKPAARYTGRLKTDPLGQLPQGEFSLFEGTGIQDDGDQLMDGLWGAQSSMSIDPMDECIFWYSNVYYESASTTNWKTRIGWFLFPECKGGLISRISLHTDGTQGNGSSGVGGGQLLGESAAPLTPSAADSPTAVTSDFEMYSIAISADGRYVAFSSEATNLVSATSVPPDVDTNGKRDIFLRDRDTDLDGVYDEPGAVSTTRITRLGWDGTQPLGDSYQVSMSADGRYIAFASDASNLVTNDTNGTRDIFVYDRLTETFTRASVADLTDLQANAASDQPFISGNGRYVAFRSSARNLTSDSLNMGTNVFLRDLETHHTYLISIPVSTPVEQNAFSPSVSYDGRYVAFAGLANNFVAGDTNGYEDVFVRDRQTGVTTRISVSSSNAQGNNDSYSPFISGNGRFIAFASRASNLVPNDTNNVADIFVRDQQTGKTSRISTNFAGIEAQNGPSYTPSISYDGQYVAFASEASNLDLIVPDVNNRRDIFLHDRSMVLSGAVESGLTTRVSLDYNRSEPNDWSFAPLLALYGRHIAFTSEASDLVPGDTNHKWDVFAYDSQRAIPTFLRIPYNVPAEPGNFVSVPLYFEDNDLAIDAATFSIDFDGYCLFFDSLSFNLPAGFTSGFFYDPLDINGEIDVYIYDQTLPYNALVDGLLLTMNFTVNPVCQAAPGDSAYATVGFSNDPQSSFASQMQTIPGRSRDGSVRILGGKLGDCNSDTSVNAGDLTALVLEIFDGDPSDPPSTPGGTFAGNAIGCNPNLDYIVDAGDLSCNVAIILGGSCGNWSLRPFELAAYGPTSLPGIQIPPAAVTLGGQVNLPIRFDPAGQNISSLAFSVNFDPQALYLDPTDANQDGSPDAIHFNLPGGFRTSIGYEEGRLNFVIWSMSSPQQVLPPTDLIEITFAVVPGAAIGDTAVTFGLDPYVSYGTLNGQSVYGTQTDGLVTITPYRLYLPVLQH